MSVWRFSWTFLGTLLLGVAIVDLAVLAYGYAIDFHEFSSENGPVENLQLLFLAVAAVVFGGLAFRLTHAARLVALGAGALCLQFFFREFRTPIPNPILEFLSSSQFLALLAAALGALILIQIYLNWAHIPALITWLVRFEWWPFLLGGILLVVSDLFEKTHLELVEEMIELNASVVFAIIAARARYAAGARPWLRRPIPADRSRQLGV